MKYIICYSGGHSSAIAAIETVRKYGKENVILLNHDINKNVEHPDIKRFKAEIANYLGLDITYANMTNFENKDQFDVCVSLKAFKYGGQSHALCTHEIKTKPFANWLKTNYPSQKGKVRDDVVVVYGFDPNEQNRIERRTKIMTDMGYKTDYPLTWEKRTVYATDQIGIEQPSTYGVFKHANCLGCLKAGKQHWYVIYCLHPDIWEKAKAAEDKIGYSILKKGYLKDLENEFALLKALGLEPTEKTKSQTFWAEARKMTKGFMK